MTIAAASDSPMQEEAMRSAFDWIRSFGEYICSNGTQCFSQSVRKLYGLMNEEVSGTCSGTQVFSDGTALTLGLGYTSDGRLYPSAACAMIVQDSKEIIRIDWNENAARNRDRWVHAHISGSRNHIYTGEWHTLMKELEATIRRSIGENALSTAPILGLTTYGHHLI